MNPERNWFIGITKNQVQTIFNVFCYPQIWLRWQFCFETKHYKLTADDITLYLYIPASIYLLKVNKRNTRTRCDVQYWQQRHQNDAIGIILVSLLWTLNIFHTLSWCFYVNFEHVTAKWRKSYLSAVDQHCSAFFSYIMYMT